MSKSLVKTWEDWRTFDGNVNRQGSGIPNGNQDIAFRVLVRHSYSSSGMTVDGYRQLISDEFQAGTNYDLVKIGSELGTPLFTTLKTRNHIGNPDPHTYTDTGFFSGFNAPPAGYQVVLGDGSLSRDLQSKVSKKLVRRLRELDHQFMGAVFLGELKPTFEMLLRPMSSLRNAVARHVRRLSSMKPTVAGNPVRARKVLADTWLEATFGWQPLLSDVKDAAIALARLYHNIPRSRFKVSVSGEQVGLNADLGTTYLVDIPYHRYRKELLKTTYVYYGMLKHLPNDTSGLGLLDRCIKLSGFDLRSFVPTVWELIPWSFLVDYFTNVSDILDAYSTDTSVIRWMCFAKIDDSSIEVSAVPDEARAKSDYGTNPVSGTFDGLQGGTGTGKSTYRHFQRIKDPPFPYPGLEFNLELSYKQMLNIAALVAGGNLLRPFY